MFFVGRTLQAFFNSVPFSLSPSQPSCTLPCPLALAEVLEAQKATASFVKGFPRQRELKMSSFQSLCARKVVLPATS